MIVKLAVPVLPGDDPPHLHLEPECDSDRRVLRLLLDGGYTCGAGMDRDGVSHCQVSVGVI